ncbi:MAG TPA: hypothetical protein VLF43_03385 [Candidatus Saccharimonadales bacterium]|nr:hypothetical protein [Candidatus Saccharimonadales bacterium]
MKQTKNSKSSSIAVNPVLQRVFMVAVFSMFLMQVIQVGMSLTSPNVDAGTYISMTASVIGVPLTFFVAAYLVLPKAKGTEAAVFGATLLTVVGVAIFALISQLLIYIYVIPGTSHGLQVGSYQWTVFGAAFGLYAAVLYCLKRCNSL